MQMLYTESMSEWNPHLPGNMHALTAGRVSGCVHELQFHVTHFESVTILECSGWDRWGGNKGKGRKGGRNWKQTFSE